MCIYAISISLFCYKLVKDKGYSLSFFNATVKFTTCECKNWSGFATIDSKTDRVSPTLLNAEDTVTSKRGISLIIWCLH